MQSISVQLGVQNDIHLIILFPHKLADFPENEL